MKKVKILLVEDARDWREWLLEALHEIMRELDIEFEIAEDVPDAIKAMEAMSKSGKHYDLIITDWKILDLLGRMVLICAFVHQPATKVVIHSSNDEYEIAEACGVIQPAEIMRKDLAELKDNLLRAIRNYTDAREVPVPEIREPAFV